MIIHGLYFKNIQRDWEVISQVSNSHFWDRVRRWSISWEREGLGKAFKKDLLIIFLSSINKILNKE